MDFSEIIDFWFGAPATPQRGRHRQEWFRKNPEFDTEIRRRFLHEHEAALAGSREQWEATPLAALALIIELDQFPRNMFRDNPRSFAADAAALGVARRMLEKGFDRLLRPIERCFAYLPFEHCEDLAAQRRSLVLYEGLRFSGDCGGNIDYAYRHYEIIVRFGRFPHRNVVLDRVSTPEEIEFLRQPGSGF